MAPLITSRLTSMVSAATEPVACKASATALRATVTIWPSISPIPLRLPNDTVFHRGSRLAQGFPQAYRFFAFRLSHTALL